MTIDLKVFPRCCPTRHYVLLGLIRLDNNVVWEIYECQECDHRVRKCLGLMDGIEQIKPTGGD